VTVGAGPLSRCRPPWPPAAARTRRRPPAVPRVRSILAGVGRGGGSQLSRSGSPTGSIPSPPSSSSATSTPPVPLATVHTSWAKDAHRPVPSARWVSPCTSPCRSASGPKHPNVRRAAHHQRHRVPARFVDLEDQVTIVGNLIDNTIKRGAGDAASPTCRRRHLPRWRRARNRTTSRRRRRPLLPAAPCGRSAAADPAPPTPDCGPGGA
jgi:hypothetical protein